jgi:hypothetical protein
MSETDDAKAMGRALAAAGDLMNNDEVRALIEGGRVQEAQALMLALVESDKRGNPK